MRNLKLILLVMSLFAFSVKAQEAAPKIAFVARDTNTDIVDIYVVNPDGTELTNLTQNSSPGYTNAFLNPLWSPDGTMLLFFREPDLANGLPRTLHTFDLATSEMTAISEPDEDIQWITPDAWSPDGNAVVYTRTLPYEDVPDGRTHEIVVVDLENGTTSIVYTDENVHPAFNSSPVWSPDGRITFNVHQEDIDLYIADVDGGNLEALVTGANSQYEARWSPDGKTLYYRIGEYPDHFYNLITDIMVLDVATSESKRLAASEEYHYLNVFQSPDGQWIATNAYRVLEDRGFEGELQILNLDGEVIHHIGAGSNPSWSADSAYLAYRHHSDDTVNGSLVIFDLSTGESEFLLTDEPLDLINDVAWQHLSD